MIDSTCGRITIYGVEALSPNLERRTFHVRRTLPAFKYVVACRIIQGSQIESPCGCFDLDELKSADVGVITAAHQAAEIGGRNQIVITSRVMQKGLIRATRCRKTFHALESLGIV